MYNALWIHSLPYSKFIELTLDYGKRVSRSPRFEPKGSESNILK